MKTLDFIATKVLALSAFGYLLTCPPHSDAGEILGFIAAFSSGWVLFTMPKGREV